MIKPIFEFLLWDNCNNNCSFCFQRKTPRIFNIKQQDIVLTKTIKYIESNCFIDNSHILLCGGEIFDDYNRKDILNTFFNKILYFLEKKRIDLLYLNTNLIYSKKNLFVLINILLKFEKAGVLNRLKFTTSYDLKGRFKTPVAQELFLSNILDLKKHIPNLNIVTNIILTNNFCEAVLNKKFDIIKFCKIYNIYINLIPYIVLDKNLLPTQKQIFKTIKYIQNNDANFINNWLVELNLKQPRIMLYYKNNAFIRCECGTSICGHSENFKKYTEKQTTCFVCDMKMLFNYV